MDLVIILFLKVPVILVSMSTIQFDEFGLIPLTILRKIEEMYENDLKKLDTAFNGFDKCSGKSILF